MLLVWTSIKWHLKVKIKSAIWAGSLQYYQINITVLPNKPYKHFSSDHRFYTQSQVGGKVPEFSTNLTLCELSTNLTLCVECVIRNYISTVHKHSLPYKHW